jgi:hypothetical protein
MIESCKTEIIELHQFFEDWFCGRISDTHETFKRLEQSLAAEFEMITPGADIIPREKLLKQLRSMNGAYKSEDKPSAIWVKHIEGRRITHELCLMRYEEWQGDDNQTNPKGRLSSALFRRTEETPNSVEWVHLHEVWITNH